MSKECLIILTVCIGSCISTMGMTVFSKPRMAMVSVSIGQLSSYDNGYKKDKMIFKRIYAGVAYSKLINNSVAGAAA